MVDCRPHHLSDNPTPAAVLFAITREGSISSGKGTCAYNFFFRQERPLLANLQEKLMNVDTSHEITALLRAWGEGDQAAYERLAGLVYGDLHRLAERQLRHEHNEHTLNASALVNETFLKLDHCQQMHWQDRQHFYNMAALLMRRVLVNYANAQNRHKRWGQAQQVTLEEPVNGTPSAEKKMVNLLALDEALTRLEQKHTRCAKVVELRYFGGLTEAEMADLLQVSERTVKRDWTFAQAWLQNELSR